MIIGAPISKVIRQCTQTKCIFHMQICKRTMFCYQCVRGNQKSMKLYTQYQTTRTIHAHYFLHTVIDFDPFALCYHSYPFSKSSAWLAKESSYADPKKGISVFVVLTLSWWCVDTGCGKTTFLDLLTGRRNTGTIEVRRQ